MKEKIKAVFFDFDDTLGDRDRYAYDCYRDILKENCDIQDPVLFEAVLQDCMLWDEKGNINHNHCKEMLKKKYQIELPCEDFTPYWDARLWKYCVPFPDTVETLTYLEKKYMLGIITNGPSDGQHKKIHQAGLDRFFSEESITVSGDYGFAKPDVRLFQAAMDKMHVKPDACVYVGDIFANDVLGAYRAGMHPVWIWTAGERKCMADIPVIHHISDLMKIM